VSVSVGRFNLPLANTDSCFLQSTAHGGVLADAQTECCGSKHASVTSSNDVA
jgi:hypothetical protein